MNDIPNDESTSSQPRASLLGKGWQILRGEASPATQAPGGEVPAPADRADMPGEVVIDWVAAPELTKMRSAPVAAPEATPAPEGVLPTIEPERPPVTSEEREAIPRIEMSAMGQPEPVLGYEPKTAVEGLTPFQPEELLPSGVSRTAASPEEADGGGTGLGIATPVESLEASGAVILPQDTRIDSDQLVPSTGAGRPAASDLFADERDVTPDGDLLDLFVTDERMEKLWGDIEVLQAELVDRVQGDRTLMDAYQKELLQASALLLQDRANYDDVRAILYRVRADLARDERIRQDIRKYKPQILIYLVLGSILWLVLMGLEPVFSRFVTEVVGLQELSLIYHPTLFGMLGAIVNAYFTLNKHTVQQRDFDPVHLSWYLMNPLVGIIMGLLMTLVFGAGIVSTIGVGLLEQGDTQILGQYPFLLWVLCFLAGYNQNVVLRLLQRTFSMLRGNSESASDSDQTPDNPASPAA